MKTLEVTAAVIRQKGRVLICQRPADKSCGLKWEFPGGKLEPGETGEACVIRECREELGITLRAERELARLTYEYPDRIVHLRFYLCVIAEGTPVKKEHRDMAWVLPQELKHYDFCPADKAFLQRIDLKGAAL